MSSAKSKRGKGPFKKDCAGLHVFIQPPSDAKSDFLEGWIVSYDEEAERGDDGEPGLSVIHSDGYKREYWIRDLVEKGDKAALEKPDPEDAVQYYLGGGQQLSKAEVNQKMKQRKNLGGGEAGQAALASGNFKGRRLCVWWPAENKSYSGVAFEADPKNPMKWHVGFDEDGDMDCYDLANEQWTLERTQVLIQDDNMGMMVHFDEACGQPCEVEAFAACKAGTTAVKVGNHSIRVNCTPDDKKARKQDFVFIYPRRLRMDEAEAKVDNHHHVRVSVPVEADQS